MKQTQTCKIVFLDLIVLKKHRHKPMQCNGPENTVETCNAEDEKGDGK